MNKSNRRVKGLGEVSIQVRDLAMNSTVDLEQIAYRWTNVHAGGDVYDSPGHHWIAALQGRCDLLPSAEVALNTMLISEGIYLSDQLGREVTADEVRERSRTQEM